MQYKDEVSREAREVVVFGPTAPFPVEGKAALRQLTQAVFTNSESATWTVINPQYHVIGSTGVVYFCDAAAIKPKDGPLQILGQS